MNVQVPSACDLGRIVPQLAYLRNFAGCVELPLKKARLLDPNNTAAIPGPEGRLGREVSPHLAFFSNLLYSFRPL